MTKTNRSTLIATFLLGVLLYTILRFAADLNIMSDGRGREPPPATDDPGATAVPRITTAADLRAVLDTILAGQDGGDAAAILDSYTRWSDARGFSGDRRLFGAGKMAPTDATVPIDETELQTRSRAGDALASQALAARRLFDDPLSSLELLHTAAEQGSTFALLRIASLLEALNTAGIDAEMSAAARDQRAIRLTNLGFGDDLGIGALGYLLTAARDGGPPIIDGAMLAWLDRLTVATTSDQRVTVCEWSERKLLDIAGRRARRGKPAITTAPPAVFIAIPDLADRLPCSQTQSPVENLIDLTNCSVTEVRNGADEPRDLYLCPDH